MAAGSYKAQPIIPFDPPIYQRGTVSQKEGSGETFKRGAPVLQDGDGYIVVYAGGGLVYGFAAEDAHNTTSDGDKDILIWRPLPGERFLVAYQDAIAQTDIGDTLGLIVDPTNPTSGTWVLDEGDSTDEMVVLGFPEGPGQTEIGDTIKYCYAALLQTTLQYF